MKITLFVPCLVDQAAPETARATVRLLERLGHTVIFPRQQTCCGQALFNAGFRSEAKSLAERFLRVFADSEVIVAPSGSCVSMVVNHYGEFDLPSSLVSIWNNLRGRVFELCSFLVHYLKVEDVGAYYSHKVSCHNSCHSLRDLGIKEQPIKLLKAVDGLELITGDWNDECCGFGGVFSAKYPELSHAIADRRAIALASGGAQRITGVDDSCLHNLHQAFRRIGTHQRTIHIARILASSRDKK